MRKKERDDAGRKDLQKKKKKDEIKREGKNAKITRNGGYG